MRVFLLTGITLAIALTGCGPKSGTGAKVDPSLETLVPADTVLLVGTRLDALMKTPIYQKNFSNREIPQIDEFAKRTGVDPRKDLWQLLYVFNGKQGVLLGRGKFADEMMEPNLAKEGIQKFSYNGVNMYGNDRGAVVLLSPTTAAAAEIPVLHDFIDAKGKSSGPPPALSALMKEIPGDSQFWAAYSGGPVHLPFDANSNLANVNKLVAYVQSGTVYFDLRTGLNGVIHANCASEEGAQQVESAMRALIGLGRLSVPKDQPELAKVYDTLRVTQESRSVKLYIDVPQAMVDKFLNVWLGKNR